MRPYLLLLLLSLPLVLPCPTPCSCPDPTTLNCSDLGLTSVPTSSDFPTSTRSLQLAGNQLTDLFGQLDQLSDLEELDLSRNPVKQLGRGSVFHDLSRLRVLNLSRCDFRTVFNGVFRGVPCLEVLDLRHGQLRFAEERVFEGLPRLRVLLLSHNQLSAVFPEWFKDLESLDELRLEDNHIAYVNGGCFSSLRSLRQLWLNGNRIRGVSDHAFDGLTNLTLLSLEDNQLIKVPSTSFKVLGSLNVLKLGGNAFSQLNAGDFVKLPALEEISVENVEELELVDEGAFTGLPRLVALHLHHNARLSFVDPHALVNVPSLRLLSLHGNALSALSEDIVTASAQPIQVSLHDNPFVCDCNVKWVHDIVTNASKGRVKILQGDRLQCRGGPLVSSLNASDIPEQCAPSLVGERNSTVDKRVGDSHVFQCRANGLPTPGLRWVLPPGLNQTRVKMKGGALELHHIQPGDSGVYVCVASNTEGEASSSTRLVVEDIDIHLFPLGVASTFVTVVWNGTARNAFPEYEIKYRREDTQQKDRYRSVTVNQFFRSYTINHLLPGTPYLMCIGTQGVQFSCTRVSTRDESFAMQGVHRTSNVAVGVSLGIVGAMGVVVCVAVLAARRNRQRHYHTPQKEALLAGRMVPLESIHSPLMAARARS